MRSWNRDFCFLAFAVFSVGMFFGIYFALFFNFIENRFAIEAPELGYMEALREVPGFLNALFIATMVYFAPPTIGGISLVVMGLGMAAYSHIGGFGGLLFFSLVWSVGFHAWVPLRSLMAITHSESDEKGKPIGQLRSVESCAMLGAITLCMFCVEFLEFEGLFLIGGGISTIGGIVLMFSSRQLRIKDENRFVIRKRYWLFYLLSFLQGCRKQIFITFAIFALVKVYGTNRDMIIKLILINQIIIFIFSPIMGQLVDKLGERIMLSASYLGLALVFIGYATLKNINYLYVLYCIDNFLFVGGIALTTYLNKITTPKDLKPTLAMGVTMNHIAAVTSPLIGGLVWMKFGYQIIFISGAAFALISLVFTQWLRVQPVVFETKPEFAD